MSERNRPDRAGEADRIEQLLRNAAERERPSAEDERSVREALHAEWQSQARRRRWQRTAVPLAAAALLMLGFVALLRPPGNPEPGSLGVPLAQIEMSTGTARILPDPPADGGTAAQESVYAGQRISTGQQARLALAWRDGSSVRVDQGSALALNGQGAIQLERGRVYVDARGQPAGADSPVILTPAGPVRHVGTQYMAAVDSGTGITRISVREGLVALEAAGAEHRAGAGQQLSVERGGRPDIMAIPVYGADWRWAESLAAPFDSDGRSIAEFLDWVGRETGRRVEFESAGAEALAQGSNLHGDIDAEPLRALELVLQASRLSGNVEGGIIRVRLRSED